ncbi:MAG: hypothetical protein IPH62_17855 [Ignavibacteriae bacterium]|nr:hypothetical protein [Ignavibacteriota bacterium]
MERVSVESTNRIEFKNEIATSEEIFFELNIICKNKNTLNRLTYFTLGKIWYYFEANSMHGKTEKDILQDIFQKFIEGERTWNKVNVRTFENQLIMAIVSEMRNEFHKNLRKLNKLTEYEKPKALVEFNLDEDEKLNEKYLEDKKSLLDIETQNEESIFNKCIEDEIVEIKKILENDVNAYFVLEEILNGETKDIPISQTLKIEIEEVRNAKKRIRRAAGKVRKRGNGKT